MTALSFKECNDKGLYEFSLENYTQSVKFFKKSLLLNKNQPETYFCLGLAFEKLNLPHEALDAYANAVKLKKNYVDALYNSGILLHDLRVYNRALAAFEDALKIEYSAQILNNKGLVLKDLRLFNEALETFEDALKVDTELLEVRCEIADTYKQMGAISLAIDSYLDLINIKPEYFYAYFSLSLIYLSNKNFEKGWQYNRHKFFIANLFDAYPNSSKPIWNGIEEGVILIRSEQGLGDNILFSSLLNDIDRKNKEFCIAVDERLLSLFKRSFKPFEFVNIKTTISELNYLYQLPFSFLGGVYRNTVSSFCLQPKKFLHADEALTNQLKLQLEEEGKYICGIAWKSKNEDFGQDKSVTLESLLPILKLPHMTFVNLQYGDTKEEIEALNKTYGIQIKTIDEIDNFNDIDGLASLIDACDFVVTTSNVTVHLAGGLGKETYLMVPYAHGRVWYWHEGDTQSIWYPSVNIHKQSNFDNWSKPIDEIAHILENKKIK